MKRLYKMINMFTDNEATLDYGFLSDEDIKLVTRGYKFDKETGVFTRKGSHSGFFVTGTDTQCALTMDYSKAQKEWGDLFNVATAQETADIFGKPCFDEGEGKMYSPRRQE